MITCLAWILLASIVGFIVPAIFTAWLKLKRDLFLLIYIPVVATLFSSFIILNDLNVTEILKHNWYWGIAGALLAGAFVLKNVFSQPPSESQKGLALVSDILWPGFAYGMADSLFLSVFPVLAVKMAFQEISWANDFKGVILSGLLSLAASLFITVFYHLGYTEFRGKRVFFPAIGNGIMTLAYLVTMNPLAAILPHIGMHIAAMVHGRETTGQVPPHYDHKI